MFNLLLLAIWLLLLTMGLLPAALKPFAAVLLIIAVAWLNKEAIFSGKDHR